MKRKRVTPPWLRHRRPQLRIGQAGARWDTLAVLLSMPREAAQEAAGEALGESDTDMGYRPASAKRA